MGGGGGPGGRLGRSFAGGSGYRPVAAHDYGWTQGACNCRRRAARWLPHVCGSPGGGRRTLTQADPGLLEALERLIEPATRGDPMSPLRWTCKSTAKLAEELTRQNHPVSDRTVAMLLKQSGYSLQANRKTREGSSHPDRNAQFEYINRQVTAFHRRQATRHLGGHEKEGIGRRIQESG